MVVYNFIHAITRYKYYIILPCIASLHSYGNTCHYLIVPAHVYMCMFQALGTVHIPDATPESELSQVLAILGALAAENDKSTLLAVLQGLSPQVLADCIIANMAHLPAADTIVGSGGSSGLAGLMQVGNPHISIHVCMCVHVSHMFCLYTCVHMHGVVMHMCVVLQKLRLL